MNRAKLFARVATELNRQDKIDLIPEWLTSAEFRLNALLRTREMVQLAVLPVASNFFPAPADYIEAESMSIAYATDNPEVQRVKARGALRYIPADTLDQSGAHFVGENPHWYTTRGNYFELGGWNIASPFQVQLFYYAELSPLATDDDTTWLLQRAPHMYINAILHFGFQHLEEYDTSDRFLQTVAAEATAMNERAITSKYAGPLIRRPTVKMGGRFS